MAKYILNTPVLTNYGVYRFEQLSLDQAKALAQGAFSAVGHKGAAEALSALLEIKIRTNRVTVKMDVGDEALVFRLLRRLPEGTVLTKEDTLNSLYEFGRLERIS